jgi:hypothetical protein
MAGRLQEFSGQLAICIAHRPLLTELLFFLAFAKPLGIVCRIVESEGADFVAAVATGIVRT